MKRALPYLLLLLLALQSCSLNPTEVTRSSQIDDITLGEINDLDMKIFSAVKGGDFNAFSQMITTELKGKFPGGASDGKWREFTEIFAHRSFRAYDEVHISSMMPGYHLAVTSLRDTSQYTLSFLTTAREMDISSLVLDDGLTQFLFTALYEKRGGKWLLNGMYTNAYSLLGKTAPEYYSQAKELYGQNDLIDAANAMLICQRCLHPFDTFIRYNKQREIERFGKKLLGETNEKYPMPYVLIGLTNHPVILGVQPQQVKGELFVQINYVSKIKLTDSINLKKENKEIQAAIGTLFQGIKQHNKHIYYRAFNEVPNEHNTPSSYGFLETVKQE